MAAQAKGLNKVTVTLLLGLLTLSVTSVVLSGKEIHEHVSSAGMSYILPASAEMSRTLLPDGRTLEINGSEQRARVISGASTVEVRLPEVRRFASVTVMPGGQILLWGGIDDHGRLLDGGQWFDPGKLRFVRTGVLGLPVRAGHTLTLLTDGRLLMTGGWSQSKTAYNAVAVWDPQSREVHIADAGLIASRIGARADLQGDGTVQVTGGVDGHGNALLTGLSIDVAWPSVKVVAARSINPQVAAPSVSALPTSSTTDAPVEGPLALRFSVPMDVRELNDKTVTLLGPGGVVPIRVVGTNDGRLAFVQLKDELFPGSRYTLFLKGLHSAQGRLLAYTATSFTTTRFNAGVAGVGEPNPPSLPGDDSSDSSAQPPLYLMTGEGHDGCNNSKQLCRPHSFVREGAFYPGEDNVPDFTGAHWRLYAPHQAIPDTHKLESVLRKDDTVLIGQVRQIDETPVENVEVSVGDIKVTTDAQGLFVLRGVSPGRQELFVDGGPASHDGVNYGRFLVGENVKAKSINHVPYVMYLPRVLPRDEVALPTPSAREVVLRHPDMPGLEIHVPAGATFKDRRGHLLTHIAIVPTPVDHAPFPLPDNFPMYFTLQPGDAVVQGLTPEAAKGIRVVYPNYGREPANSAGRFWLYSAKDGWRMYGSGHVTADAKQIAPAPGVSFVWAMGAGVTLGNANPPNNMTLCGKQAGQPVDLQTGTFLHHWNDFSINDIVPLVMTRAYNSADANSHMFGIGGNSNFGMHLYSTVNSLQNNQTFVTPQLVLPCGEAVVFNLVAGTDTWPLNNTVWEHAGTNSAFYGATLQFFEHTPIGEYWQITMKDGTELGFQSEVPNQLIWLQDRYGNQEQLSYNGGLLDQVISPSGRTISFSYDGKNRVTSAVDNAGRTMGYAYNPAGALSTVTYPDATNEQYGYDNNNRMQTMQDRRGNVWVTNQYDANGRVTKQTYADNTNYQFAYVVNGATVTSTLVTDPNGHKENVVFDPVSGYPSSDTLAYGTTLAQTTTFVRESSGLVDSTTDAMGRTTVYTYDNLGNVLTVTKLAGTSHAVTTQFGYTTDYAQLASIIDPLGHKTRLSYTNGCLTQVTNPLGNATTIQCNAAGQPLTVTDAMSNTSTLAYQGYDLQSVTDPLNRTVSFAVDSLGRRTAERDPAGNVTLTQYDLNDRVSTLTDALNQTTSITYDGNGNPLTVTLPNQGVIGVTYDARNRPSTRTDALSQEESWTYDGMGHVSTHTDRKGQMTDYTYDALNRLSLVVYADNTGTQATYDAGNRLTGLVDSSAGTTNWSFDDLDRVLSEANSQGTISYTYDAADRRSSMTPAAQAIVNYTYDNANRLTTLSQGSESVQFTYDADNRRATLTLPNGIVASYGYNQASQLTSLKYVQASGTVLGTLNYGYDSNGRRVSKSGSFATDMLPTPTTQPATFDLNDRKTSFNGTSLGYDANGNLINDGTNTYTWNTRNQLVQISQGGVPQLTFAYDALGRRISKSVQANAPIQFLYDGANAVQEMQSGVINPILTGLSVDERYARNDVTGRTYFLTDALNSTIGLTDPTGALREQYSYDPYGNMSLSDTTSGFTNPYQYTGREADTAGLYYFRARYYSPVMGSFISEDPITFGGGQLSFYAYVGGNPLSYIDPYGLWAWGDPLPQGLVDGVTGFGDGVYAGITFGLGNLQDVRDLAGIDGGVDPCSAAYRYSHIAGEIEGAAALGGALASKSFVPGGWTNSNRYLRVGYGRNGGDKVFRAAGQWVKAITGDAHFDFWTSGKW